ncbi:hypothetical protein [Pseudomonas asplenii]|uniref:hypothetical protein n=1 Tax=Pseudomonas asplenii TaxID=53407 RepID=UPI00235FE94D|nr:hypothetical protein [Pseudomonas asplenii]
MTQEPDIEQVLHDALENTQVGKVLTLNFKGLPLPVEVKYFFKGGWVIKQQLVPGMPLEITRGEDDTLEGIEITLLPYDGMS